MTDNDTQDLEALPAARLAEMLRDKRKAEQSLRNRLRDAEARADKAEATVQGFQREAFEGQAKDAGIATTAMQDLTTLVDLGTLLGEDGTLDPGKAKAALETLATERPHLFPPTGAAKGTGEGLFSGSQGTDEPAAPTWADVVK